mgnify:CR=1 FL=1
MRGHLIDARALPAVLCDGRDLGDYPPEWGDCFRSLQQADGFVLATPVYLYSCAGATKNLVDILGEEGRGLQTAQLFVHENRIRQAASSLGAAAACAAFEGFNRWLDEDWGCNYKNTIFSAPYIPLCDVGFACEELEWALAVYFEISRGTDLLPMAPGRFHAPAASGW